jgi:hypothetical protein
MRSDAQVRNRVDHRGKEFWAAFLQTNGAADFPNLSLSISCEKPTKGWIVYLNTGDSVQINLSIPNRSYRITLDTFKLLLPNPHTTEITNRSVHLRFEDEVTVYGINTQRWSSDAFLALPNDALGTDYMILSYPNTQAPDTQIGFPGQSDFPSQFALIATEDKTTVTIIPTARVNNRRNTSQFTVTLNKGEIFFGQANGNTGTDLSGTRVKSDRPVVVYGSHQRANIPYTEAIGRDHLVEQLPPINKWGQRMMLTPHFQLLKTVPDANIVRVIAANEGTVVSVDSAAVQTLNAGQVLELPLDRAKLLTATGPIMVAQYQHSTVDTKFITFPADTIGDPFMMLVPPQEHFDSAYAFESFGSKDFTNHFINVVIPTERIASLVLDGSPVTTPFSRIEKTSYSYTQIPLDSGSHRITARVPFGLYIYGFGPYNSYGYPGGMVFDTLFKDQKPPQIAVYDTCGGIAGKGYDDSTHDFGMEDVRLLSGSRNVNLVRSQFKVGTDSIHFRLDLINPYQDGFAEMIAVDTAGLDARTRFPVKGFTVALTPDQSAPVRYDTLASLNGMEFCRTVTLYNYGQFPQTINGLRLSTTIAGLSVKGSFPTVLQPGERRDFDVCFQHAGDTALMVQISVDNGCLQRPLVDLPLISGTDAQSPLLVRKSAPCSGNQVINITELGALNSGIAAPIFTDRKNLNYSFVPDQGGAPFKSGSLVIQRIDPRQDMWYTVEITDLVGNQTVISDTIPGFTLAIESSSGQQLGFTFDRALDYRTLVLGDEICDTIYLRNYGMRPLPLNSLRVLGNLQYSIPPDQLPILLGTNERRPLAICVRPIRSGDQIDTLAIDFNCDNLQERVALHTLVQTLHGDATDRCGNLLSFEVDGFVKKSFLAMPAPNPTYDGRTNITIGLNGSQAVSLALYNDLGAEVQTMFNNDILPAGVTRIQAHLPDLPSGIYYLQMKTASGDMMVEKVVVSR